MSTADNSDAPNWGVASSGSLGGPPSIQAAAWVLQAVIHIELDRMGGHPQPSHILFLQGDVSVDQIVGEHPALGQKFAVDIQRRQGFVEVETDLGNLFSSSGGKS